MDETEIARVNPVEPEQALIERAAEWLKRGGLVVFPTETVYGLGANALQVEAVEKIFAAKERPFNDPLIVHIADIETLGTLVTEVPEVAWRLAEIFWPGPLTMILPAGPAIPKLVTAGLSTVAIRMPRHPVALALIRAAGLPIAAPSANRFMHVSPTTAEHVLTDLKGRVPLILDSGACEVGVESTVLDLCSEIPTILRPGGISLEALRLVLPEVQTVQAEEKREERDQARQAPGQMLVHYAPMVPTFLFEGETEAIRCAMLAEVKRYQAAGELVGVLVADEDRATFEGSETQVYALGNTVEEMAARLFAGLRTLEESGVQVILCRSFGEEGLGRAIRDRLIKAAGGKVIRTG